MSGLGRVRRSIMAASILTTSSNPSSSATIEAKADTFVDVRVEGQIMPGDAERLATLALSLRREDTRGLNWLHVSIDSGGGSVSEALRIGRFLRRHNAFVGLRKDDQCLSSCVFILMAGVMRDAHWEWEKLVFTDPSYSQPIEIRILSKHTRRRGVSLRLISTRCVSQVPYWI